MPQLPNKPCRFTGCPNVVSGKPYCDKHKAGKPDNKRPSSAKRGYDRRWRKARRAYLQQHPLCVKCEGEGKITPSLVVDHIIPHKGNKMLFWDTSNWQALCKTCHDSKTAREDGGFGRD